MDFGSAIYFTIAERSTTMGPSTVASNASKSVLATICALVAGTGGDIRDGELGFGLESGFDSCVRSGQ